MTDHFFNNQWILYLLILVLMAAIIWHFIENHWDSKIFEKDRKGIFKNLHAKGALYAFDHVDGLIPVDVRSKEDYGDSHIPGAINAPWDDNDIDEEGLKSIDRDAPILLYCEGGFASRRSIESLKKLGFHTIYHLHRGFKSWQFFGGEVEGDSD